LFSLWENDSVTITATVALEVPSLEGMSRADDLVVIEAMRAWGRARREVDAGLATLAGIVAARSTLELGYDGLAQRSGARTTDALVSQLTGTSGSEAHALTAVGSMMSDPAPWLGEVASRVSAADVIRGAAPYVGGGGGGRPTMARAGGKDAERLPDALAEAERLIRAAL